MAAPYRRSLLVFSAILLIALTAIGFEGHGSLTHAQSLPAQSFAEIDPPKLYETDRSHHVVDAEEQHGYCIDGEGVRGDSLYGPAGFSVVVDDELVGGNIVETDVSGDVHCVAVRSHQLERPDQFDGTMRLQWAYTDGFATDFVTVDIEVFRIGLEGFDGLVGGAAEVCTINWDADVLTGRHEHDRVMALPVDEQDEMRLDRVRPGDQPLDADWQVDGPANYEKYQPPRRGDEWCVSIAADSPGASEVTFNFNALYWQSLPAYHAPGNSVSFDIEFTDPDYAQLQHVAQNGVFQSWPESGVNAINARHHVCIAGTTADDGISDVQISPEPVPGEDWYRNNPATRHHGVPEGTWCFSWYSTEPGYQSVQVDYIHQEGTANEEQRRATWDTNGDGNGNPDYENYPLQARWGVVDRTEITIGNDPDENIVTNSSITRPLFMNFADGYYGIETLDLTEWVHGFTGADADTPALIDGVILEASIVSSCGYFLTEATEDDPDVNLKQLEGRSIGGRFDHTGDGLWDDLRIIVTGDTNCSPQSTIRLEIDAYYPDRGTYRPGEFIETEWLEINFDYSTTGKTPRLAWVGDTVTTTFSVAGGCEPLDGDTVNVVTGGSDQPGTFLPREGVEVHGPHAVSGTFSDDDQPGHDACTFTFDYTAQSPGKVDLEFFLEGKPWTQTSYPVYFMEIEDITLSAAPDMPVQSRGWVSASVRGWFPANTQSGREQTVHDDGRVTPADRWVMPDDWDRFRGGAAGWPGSAPMPGLPVTFSMEDEDKENAFPGGPTEGAAGWFRQTGAETSVNRDPRTGRESELGSRDRPRIITATTDGSGNVSVDTTGDFNLSYEGCEENAITGNPHCGRDQVVGSTSYYAVADYGADSPPSGPVRSNTADTTWRWSGYKDVSIVDTADPGQKYVVVRMRDRGGSCDALGEYNTLGAEVDFLIDSGTGRIVEAGGEVTHIVQTDRRATVTTVAPYDDYGNPINEDLVREPVADECQAWVKVSNHLLTSTSLVITIPGQPAPVPGDLRITGLQCSMPEQVTITNEGDEPVGLSGFALRSFRDEHVDPEQHRGLAGVLEPGESKTVDGGPLASLNGWLFPSNERIFGDQPNDYARLVWNEFEVDRLYCDGTRESGDLPDPLPADGERDLVLNVTVPFHEEGPGDGMQLHAGWNLVTINGQSGPIAEVMGENSDDLGAVYRFSGFRGEWDRYLPGAPAYASTLDTFEEGGAYWVLVKQPFTLSVR